jgi:Stage II sporulation protein E (SpoIIE)
MTADHLKGLEEFEAELWKLADNLRANSNLASNEYFMPMGLADPVVPVQWRFPWVLSVRPLYRAGRCVPITSEVGWTIGYPLDNISFKSESVALARGDVLIFHTDGLSDAMRGPDPDLDCLGVDGLARIVGEACTAQSARMADAVFAGVERYRGGWPAHDDATPIVRLR